MKNTTHTITVNDWGKITTHTAETSQEIIDIVIDSGAGAFVDIDGKIKWDKSEDETTDEFWDFINQIKKLERGDKK